MLMLSKRDTDFFQPPWRRVAVVGFCAGWSGWEFSNGETFWAGLALAIAAYGVWVFFISFDNGNKVDQKK